MQEEQRSMQEDDEQVVSPSLRTQRIIEYLEDLWKRPHTPSHDDLKRITEFVIGLPEEYRTVGLTTIANHFVNGMGLHMLDNMAKFQQKAEQEGISPKECRKTFDNVLPETFQVLATLSRQVSVTSLDGLAILSNISIALYTLSRADSAEEAQTWLYELPEAYHNELVEKNLVVNLQDQEGEPPFTHWMPYKSKQSYIISQTDSGQPRELTPAQEKMPAA